IYDQQQPDSWRYFNNQSLLGGALVGQKKYADAEPLLLQGYEGLRLHEPSIPAEERPRRLLQAIERLGELYDAWGKPDEASKWRDRRNVHERVTTAPADHGASAAPATSQP